MRATLAGLAAALLAAGACAAAEPVPPSAASAAELTALPPPLADYHLHLQSPALSAALQAYARRDPAEFAIMDAGMLQPRGGAAALKVLDAAGIRYGVLLSEGYMFASPRLAAKGDLAALTRAENAFTVREAQASGGRLTAFIGVDPLSPTAARELAYWSPARGAAGLKLHMGNSNMDFASAKDVAALGRVFALAGERRLPIVIHLRAGKDFGARQVNLFIDEVLPQARGDAVQVAHGGGWGFLDATTVESLSTFADAIVAKRPGTEHLTFDLTLVVVDDKTDPVLAAQFVAAMRRIGMDRFAFGSDWPAKYTPAQALALVEHGLPLTAAEWRTILAHRAAFLPPAAR